MWADREAFWNVYRPGCLEHYVLHVLRDHPDFIPELNLVMERDGRLIGQNVFARAVIHADDGRDVPVATMGPIGIAPEFKRQGYGKRLLDDSLERARRLGIGALCFEGISVSTARVALTMPAGSASTITVCWRGRMRPSSCAGS